MPPNQENTSGQGQELEALKQEVQRQNADAIRQEVHNAQIKAAEVQQALEFSLQQKREQLQSFEGSSNDPDTLKGKAHDIKKAVVKILFAQELGKIPQPVGKPPEAGTFASDIVTQIASRIRPQDVSEQTAPYLFHMLHKAICGDITDVQTLVQEFGELQHLALYSKEIYKRLQDAVIKVVENRGISQEETRRMFGRKEDGNQEETTERNTQNGIPAAIRQLQQMDQREFQEISLKTFIDLTEDERGYLKDLSTDKQMILKERINSSLKDLFIKIKSYVREGSNPSEYSIGQSLKVIGGLLIDPALIIEADLAKYDFLPNELMLLKGLSPVFRILTRGIDRAGRMRYLSEADAPGFFESFGPEGIRKHLQNGKLTEKGKRTLKRDALKFMNKMLKIVDENPDIDFNQSYSDLREGYNYWALQGELIELADDPELKRMVKKATGEDPKSDEYYEEIRKFIKKGIIEELSRERSLRELFHNIGIWIKTLDDPAKIAEFIARHNISEVSSVAMSDVSGFVIKTAMSEYERYLQYSIAMNKGNLPISLFSGKVDPNELYYDIEDRTNLKERLVSLMKSLGQYVSGKSNITEEKKEMLKNQDVKKFDIENIEEFDESWELERALKYAKGLSLIGNLRGYEVIASGRPPDDFRGSAENFTNMAARFNPMWFWVIGKRGGKRLLHMPAIAEGVFIKKKPEQSLWKRITETWNPHAIEEKALAWNEEKQAEQWDKIKDSWLWKDVNFRVILNKFGLGGLATRGAGPGWRIFGLKEGIFDRYISKIQKAIEEKAGEDFKNLSDWDKKYDILSRVVGIGARFWYDDGRAKEFVQKKLFKEKFGHDPKEMKESEIAELWNEYVDGKHAADEIFPSDDGQIYTVSEFLEMKSLVFKGMNFQALLERSPIDFLNNLITLSPEILPDGVMGGTEDYCFQFDLAGEEINKNVLASRIRGELAGKKKGDIESEIEKVYKMQVNLKRIWGAKNLEHIAFVRNFYKKIEKWGRGRLGKVEEKLSDKEKAKIKEDFLRMMEFAVEKVKLRNDKVMEENDIDDEGLRKIFFGAGEGNEKGLIPYFRNLEGEDFGIEKIKDEHTQEEKYEDASLGKRGFFFHMARGWYNELGHSLHPNTAEVDWRYVFHEYGALSGEDTTKRLWGHLANWNKTISKLVGFEHMLEHAAVSGNLDEIKKFMQEIHLLEDITTPQEVYEQQYYLAQVVIRFFQEHSNAQLPLFFGSLYKMFNPGSISLSRLHTGKRDAFTFTPDGANAFIQELMHTNILAKEGPFSGHRLMKAMAVDWEKNLVKEIIPGISQVLILYLLYKWISESLKESIGGKK